MKYIKGIRKTGVALGIAAVSSIATYVIVDTLQDQTIEDLRNEIRVLKEKELQSIVTQRISEQMEDIAFQQKEISEKQREEAEKQSQIADMERGKAMMERGLAQAAERKAIASAAQADSMRYLAEAQTKLARKNMLVAQEAQAHADTLFYQSMSNSLAQSALAIGTSNDLTHLLSYAAWHYSKLYNNNRLDQTNIFKSLVYFSDCIERVNYALKGNVRALNILTPSSWALGITDYGELFGYHTDGRKWVGEVGTSNFRDMAFMPKQNRCVAITAEGTLVCLTYSTAGDNIKVELKETATLPSALWNKIIVSNSGNEFIAMSEKSLAWIDINTLAIKHTADIDGKLTAIGKDKDYVHLFAKKGLHYIVDSSHNVTLSPLTTIKDNVSTYEYDAARNHHIIGTEAGEVYVIDYDGSIIHKLEGHQGPITMTKVYRGMLLSTSFDHSIRLWSLRNMSSTVESISFGFDRWPMCFDIDAANDIVWVGNEGGNVNRFCISPTRNAEAIHRNLRRDFTPAEWQHYVGKDIPFKSFMKGGEK